MAQTQTTNPRVTLDIGQAVSLRLDNFSRARAQAQAKAEADFQSAVASGTLSPDAQVTYRQQMLAKAKSDPVPDIDYITDLQNKLASAQLLAHNYDKTTALNDKKAQAAAGLESNQQYLEDLQGMLDGENDPSVVKMIQDEITSTNNTILQARISLISSEASKGTTDQSTTELNKALDDANDEKASALAAGDTARAASMDVVISGINQQLVNIRIDSENNGLNINKNSKSGGSLGYVNQLLNLIATSDSTTPIQYQGAGSYRKIAYASEQAYWQSVLGNYLSTNFVKDIQSEYDDYVNNAAIVNKLIPSSVLDSVKSDFAQLSAMPMLAAYTTQLQQVQTEVLGTAVAKNAQAIVDNYGVDNNADSALAQLNDLSTKYGIDVSSYANKIIGSAAKQTASGVSAYYTAISNYEAQGMDYNSAKTQADKDLAAGKLTINQSSEELATETPSSVVNKINNAPANNSSSTTPPVTTPIPSNKEPNPAQQANEPANSPGVSSGLIKPTTPSNQAPTTSTTPAAASSAPASSATPAAPKPKYTGNSIVDYLNSVGQDSSFDNRTKLAKQNGIQNYSGTAQQNLQLLGILNK